MSRNNPFGFACIALLSITLLVSSCSSVNKAERVIVLGSAAGGAIGAMIGKKAGNPAIGATIGAALGGSTGAFIGSKLTRSTATLQKTKTLYVINGTPCDVKEAQDRLNKLQPEEIESVKVLNNSDAIAQFGNKGENGAILITIKTAG